MQVPDHVILVTTEDDTLSGPQCSLRAAVEAANTGTTVGGCKGAVGRNRIRLPRGMYRLTAGPLTVSGDLAIYGDPAETGGRVVICGPSGDSVITVAEDARLVLFGVTITGGGGPLGAGIVNHGTLKVCESTLRDNVASGAAGATSPCMSTPAGDQDCAGGGGGGAAGLGGALYNTGKATLIDVVLRSNAAVGGSGGMSYYPLRGQFCDPGGVGGGPQGGAAGGYTDCFATGTDGGAGGFASGGGGGGAAASAGGNGGPGGFGGGGGGGGGRTSGGSSALGGPGGFGGGAGATPYQSGGGGGGGGAGIGGAIFNDGGIVDVTRCRFADNSVSGGPGGGGIPSGASGEGICPDVFAYGGVVTVRHSRVPVQGCTANGGVIAVPAHTATEVTSSDNPAPVGHPVTYTVTVTSSEGVPTGSVDFMDGDIPIWTGRRVPLLGGRAHFVQTYCWPATHRIRAIYSGGPTFEPSTSGVFVQRIVPPPHRCS